MVTKKMAEFMDKRLEEDEELSANVNSIGLALTRTFHPLN